ncbi:hypothetical protein F6X40_27485 [Paraburkholderia sp. UCT31]|uniref:hypothetical protein n=1 Tax=Paraburkholderia sp. UCT31 TaxID=2615209 RepID=UPI001655176E|nr:hypothetical protein [Paraburkholderia sp. UCT31]MBC8740404.1 hypothetical protein [Paraburkholderia sp. UCT31]
MAYEPIPAHLQPFVVNIVRQARANLEEDGHLVSFAFVGNSSIPEVIPIQFDTRSEQAKDAAAAHVRQVAEMSNADFVLLVQDAWGLPPSKMSQYREIVERYGSVSASPHRLDVAAFILETHSGFWFAQVPITAKGLSKKKRTFSAQVEFSRGGAADGRMTNFLPKGI